MNKKKVEEKEEKEKSRGKERGKGKRRKGCSREGVMTGGSRKGKSTRQRGRHCIIA